MFKNKLLKVLALLMVLNILIIPLTNFIPQQQNKYTVHASGELVDIRFFNAMVTMIGITAVGITGMMSQSFSIPEVDMVALKDQFQATLDADATKKTAWMNAQSDYLAGGVAKTMGAVELAKIGINDIYNEFLNYIKISYPATTGIEGLYDSYGHLLHFERSYDKYDLYYYNTTTPVPSFYANRSDWIIPFDQSTNFVTYKTFRTSVEDDFNMTSQSLVLINRSTGEILNQGKSIINVTSFDTFTYIDLINDYSNNDNDKSIINNVLIAYCNTIGIINFVPFSNKIASLPIGNIDYINNQIINTTDTTSSIIPTIPWIDTSVPIGTVVTPAISAPYAGAVPIDVPLTIPIDPTDPTDPTVPNEPADVLSATLAIIAALVPISGLLDNIDIGIGDIGDVIDTGLDSVIDGIGDIAGSLTGGITSGLTDIQSSISTLFDPPTETLNIDKLKNINSVLFTKFPFSIPFDFTMMLGAFNADPVAPTLEIPFDMSSFGGENSTVKIELSQFDNIAFICRQIGFVGFVFFMLFNTRKLIWK